VTEETKIKMKIKEGGPPSREATESSRREAFVNVNVNVNAKVNEEKVTSGRIFFEKWRFNPEWRRGCKKGGRAGIKYWKPMGKGW
jgi:hypothetical protein